jgi:GT2 family glycosyltransferase
MNTSKPKVSVITPTYNRADLLPRAIESVLSQDFDDLELLIVDDGSTDNTGDVVGEFQIRDHRLRYLKLPRNRGIGFARDAGLRHAVGKYVGWVDSDDLWLPSKLRTQVAVLENHPEIEILFGDFWNINHLKGTRDRAFIQSHAVMKLLDVRHIDEELYTVDAGIERALFDGSFISLVTALFRAKTIEKVGGFDATLSGPEDFEFLWRAAVLGAKYAYLDRPLVERHKVKSSITARAVESRVQEVLEALKVCRRTCQTARRADLLRCIRTAEHRVWRRLVWAHGSNSQRGEASRAFGRSLASGFSVRTFLVFATAMLGPQAVSFSLRALHSEPYRQVIRRFRK